MFVFWFLVLACVVAFGLGMAYLFGDRFYDKANSAIHAYTDDEINGEKEKIDE